MRRRITMLIMAAMLALTMALGGAGAVSAKITQVDTGCETRGGGEPGGQQPTCKGGGLEQQTENQNPSGKAPPGQN